MKDCAIIETPSKLLNLQLHKISSFKPHKSNSLVRNRTSSIIFFVYFLRKKCKQNLNIFHFQMFTHAFMSTHK